MHPIDLWHFLESDRFDIKNTTSEVLKEPQSPEKNHAGSTWSKKLPSPKVPAPPHSKTNMLHSKAVKMAFEILILHKHFEPWAFSSQGQWHLL